MDQVVRTVVALTLFGGTAAVIVMVLPRIVVYCLEIVEHARAIKSRKETLVSPDRDSHRTLAEHVKSMPQR